MNLGTNGVSNEMTDMAFLTTKDLQHEGKIRIAGRGSGQVKGRCIKMPSGTQGSRSLAPLIAIPGISK